MPNLLAMSFEGPLAPCIELQCLRPGGSRVPDGWGIGFYPGGEPSASILKEPAPPEGSIRSQIVKAWEHLEASILMLHVRAARWGSISDANTQPFQRSWAGRDWLFAHSGSLRHRLELSVEPRFEPVGSTDTEAIFCELMSWVFEGRYRSLADIDPQILRRWFDFVNEHGSLTSVLSDGRDLLVYADRHGQDDAYLREIKAPYDNLVFGDADATVDLTKRGIKARKGVLIASAPLDLNGMRDDGWARVAPGQLVVVREGAIIAKATPDGALGTSVTQRRIVARGVDRAADPAPVRRFRVQHRTVYRHEVPVERSVHRYRLCPAHDREQTLLSHELRVSVEGRSHDFDDAFGNRTRTLSLDRPWQELAIDAISEVELRDTDPLALRPFVGTRTLPLIWMPSERQMLAPFVLPPELPETELAELAEYGMSFARRNQMELFDTLLDINQTIFSEYAYQQGSTSIGTTAFQVYASRRGVCQDFANLFICLARLLGIPSRYVCGYVWCGDGDGGVNREMSLASHAWVQVYLPDMGWRGFDPTNGKLTTTEHVRVATGRSYVDATPTSGTIYVGGGNEMLEVDVKVTLIDR
jgi:transglutaminase-like putative cysteine protease/predicted glutamine amidotransferase